MIRLVKFVSESVSGVGVLLDDGVVPTGYDSMDDFIGDREQSLDQVRELVDRHETIPNYQLTTPIEQPSKILCCGVNYRSHLEENPEATLPEEPFFFSKLPSSVIGPGEPIPMPYPKCLLDYEVELAVVIGTTAKGIDRTEALDHVFGYTLLNDISARDIQFKDAQITLGKGLDGFSPIGPTIVPRSEMPPLNEIELSTRVNGNTLQRDYASNTIFSVPELIELLSRWITLNPGDIVSTGTPAGVAHFRPDKPYLKPGDVVEIEATGIGILRNRVV
ncbi:MAG: fumarylacetoacetate hydrolase family protein [Dehalococcoidia bacterium]